ncbi:hypothetical protein CYCD_11590 [Tenuifilaceae bacterium CYCD]|nr:hypothetical protein CYCD_11590 [Tenuifilaceae bacterium CYCD]
MRIILSTIIILFIETSIYGQINYGIKSNLGISMIVQNYDNSSNAKTYIAPSGQIGAFSSLKIKNKSYIGLELLINQIEGREEIFYETSWSWPYNESIGDSKVKFYTHITYISIPTYYELKLNKLILNAGLQFSYCMLSSEKVKVTETVEWGTDTWEKTNKNLNIDKFNIGSRLGGAYVITSKFSIEGVCYYGLNNINSSNSTVKSKPLQITVGIRYKIK